MYNITLLWSSAPNFQMKKELPTSRHLVNKLTHSNSGLSKVQNQLMKKYFRIASGWIIWKYFFSLYILLCWNHHTDSKMTAMRISKKVHHFEFSICNIVQTQGLYSETELSWQNKNCPIIYRCIYNVIIMKTVLL